MVSIIVEAENVWDYFQKHKLELEQKMIAIAENPDYGVIIYVSNENDLPVFTVTADEYQYDEQYAVSANDCLKTVRTMYDQYLTENFLKCDEGVSEDEVSLLSIEDEIAERELELDDVVALFIGTAMDEDYTTLGSDFDEICEDVKDHFLEYLARKHDIAVRRPMILEDEDGEEFFEEYPYECMEFEDEDNPIYK